MKISQSLMDKRQIIVGIICILILIFSFPVFSQQPVADFTADQTTGCQGLVVTFTDKSDSAEQWAWSFPGGSPSSATTKGPHQITYNNPGTFDVVLEINNQYGSDKKTKSKYIIVNDCSPVADFSANKTTGCQGLLVTFTDQSVNAQQWAWSFPGGSPSSATTKGPHQITYNNPGSFDVVLEINNQYGSDKETKSTYIKINNCSPVADFSVNPTSGCTPLTVTYTDKSTNATSWIWSFPGGSPSSAQTQGSHSITYNSEGSYKATLVAANQYGQDTKVINNAVTVNSCYDYGDAPYPYPTTIQQNGARHTIDSETYLGSGVSADEDGKPDSLAAGDDDDGVIIQGEYAPGDTIPVEIIASNTGYLKAWIDFNRDGDWADSSEMVFNNVQLDSGSNKLQIFSPYDTEEGITYARFRYSNDLIEACDGPSNSGEVEDYLIYFTQIVMYEYGDAPEGALAYPHTGKIGAFPTCKSSEYYSDLCGFVGFIRHGTLGFPSSTYFGPTTDIELDGNGGFCSDFYPDGYDQDETYNDGDAGLIGPTVYIIEGKEGSIRLTPTKINEDSRLSTCHEMHWGEDIDIDYTVNSEEGAYINVLFDWNQDGCWSEGGGGCAPHYTYEHVVKNFHVPQGSGKLGDHEVGRFFSGDNHGYIWARFSITRQEVELEDIPDAPDHWNGSGKFSGGETEDYLLFFNGDDAKEFGDAPDSALAYPGTGQMGYFPTCKKWTGVSHSPEYINHSQHYDEHLVFLGSPSSITTDELDGNHGFCSCTGFHHFNKDIDNGLRKVRAYTITGPEGSETITDDLFHDLSTESPSLGMVCQMARWGTNIDLAWCNLTHPVETVYINVLMDWNKDGRWSGSIPCSDSTPCEEHVLKNLEIDVGGSQTSIAGFISRSDRNFRIGPDSGYVWARFTITKEPVELPWDGTGNFEDGETEDFLLYITPYMPPMDFGDASYPFKTRLQENGARHIINSNIHLGHSVDADTDGSPDSLASGDSNDNLDDDDGVTFQGAWILGDTVTAVVQASTKGYLSIWGANKESKYLYKQLSNKGDFPYENTKIELQKGNNTIKINVDEGDFDAGPAYFRFRYSTLPIDSADGIAFDGEVEDYRVEIFDDLDFPLEYGDAPEGIIAYPDRAVTGNFPTLKDSGPAGYVSHGSLGKMYLGHSVDYELDGDAGTAAPIGDPWDTDEGLNDRRGDVTIYRDLGLTDPCNYTIRGETGSEYYCPYSIISPRGVLGEAGETVRWGDYDLDGVYNVTDPKGAYFNVLVDWNQDGSWGGNYLWNNGSTDQVTPEHIVQNFYIPQSTDLAGYGILSDLDPPEFVLPDDVTGYVWMRWTISNAMVSSDWNGSGVFEDGETEDYLVAVNYDSLFDFGDAPQGAIAYPSTGVIGEFQTAWGIPGTIGGAIWHHKGINKYFGNVVDYEWTGNAGLAYLTPWVYDADENYNNTMIMEELQDAGLRLVMPYKIQTTSGLETVEPYIPFSSTSLRRSLGGAGETAVWGTNLDMEVSLRSGGGYDESYFTLVIDWNQDGLWQTSEIVHENLLLSHTGSSFDGMLSELGIPNFEIGPNTGYVWARFILSERPVTAWFGEYFAGETEDYLLHVSERSFLYDWGDAGYPFPTSSQENGARHLFDGNIYMGSSVDTEEDGQGDEKASSDYDDGVTFHGAWIRGDTVKAYVTVSDTGYLSIWGSFGPNGSIIQLQEGKDLSKSSKLLLKDDTNSEEQHSYEVLIPIPEDASLGTAYIRFRFSTQLIDSVGGIAPDGEVEDYRIEVFDVLEIPYEYGDAPENETAYPHLGITGAFPTFKDEGPAGYVRHGTIGEMYLGMIIDYETDGNAGVTPPIDGDYDEDEKHNEIRDFMDVSNDIGLVAPHAYTIINIADTLAYWPYSVYHMSRGSLGDEPGEIVEWGTSGGKHLDIKYHISSPDGAYMNILIDWNQNGQWGDTDEHVLENFWVPSGSDRLSNQGPPPIVVGETRGHTWMRVTLSNTTVEENWNGEDNFADGETEDYLICASYEGLYDYGDAPEGALAYPSSGVIGNFPTCVGVTNSGYIRHQHGGNRSFGRIDYEYEGNAGLSSLFTNFYNSDESFYNTTVLDYISDAGLHGVFPHTIKGAAGSEYVDAYDDGTGLPNSIGSIGQMATWGTNLDLGTNINMFAPGGAYVNVLIDWNQDGDWGDVVDYPARGITVPERILRNFYISGSGFLSTHGAPDFRIGPNSGYCWMRCTITRMPVEAWGWDGSGEYADGETEDYLIKVEDYSTSFEFGDAPILSYGVLHADSGAIHTVQAGFCLGDLVDPDPDGWPLPGGYGDDTDGSDDDDGIEFLTSLIPGQTAQIKATVSGSGFLSGWIDFNADSSWDDPGEQIWNDSQVNSGDYTVSFTVPSDAVLGVTYARFRFSDSSGLSYNGPPHFSDYPDQSSMPPKGEVEDYAVLIHAAGATYDYGDAPDPTYPTLSASSGAYHVIDNSIYLGSIIDSETNGLAHAQALGDDNDTSDDEDGVQFPSTITSGSTVTASVTLSVQGYLNIWIDLNADGDWFDLNEHVIKDSMLVGGTHNAYFSTPLVTIPDSLIFARVRYSTFPGVGVMGPAADGEVEDYLLNVIDTDIENSDGSVFIPEKFTLKQNYPNPFNPVTTFLYQLPQAANVKFTIYNIKGSVVKQYHIGLVSAGEHTLIWDGHDENGKNVATGIYIYRIQVDASTGENSFQSIKKMILIK